MFDLWRQQNHLANADITPLDKLSFIGKRGMGALEFEPELSRERKATKIDMKSLADLAMRIYKERENARILPDESITMQSLLTVGTSAGGRQPKAIIAINQQTGEIRSGQISGLKDFDYYILKFGNSQYSSAELEMTYYELATKAGIQMMPSDLCVVDGNNHFITKRFDREGERKIYTQTLAAINPEADSYGQLIDTCRKLHLPEADCQEEKPLKASLTKAQKDIVNFCSVPRSAQEIMDRIGVSNQTANRKRHILPLVDMGVLEMTILENPNDRNQKYRKVRKE